MAWIHSHQALAKHPKTLRLARLIAVPIPHAIGLLHMLWWWCLDYAPDGSLTDFEAGDIASAVLWEGDADALIDGLAKARFIDRSEDGMELQIHDWDEYGGRLFEQREANAERARRSRESRTKSKRARESRVTHSGLTGLEERRGEKKREEGECGAPRCVVPPEPGSGLRFLTVGKGSPEWEAPASLLTATADAFPGVDVEAEWRKASLWLVSHRDRLKTPRGMPKFLTGWVARAVDRGDFAKVNGSRPAPALVDGLFDSEESRLRWNREQAALAREMGQPKGAA